MSEFVVETGLGVVGSNSLTSVEFADDYFSSHPFYYDTWEEFDVSKKQSLLISATRDLNSRVPWPGTRVSPTQSLPFPRDGLELDGFVLSSNSVPTVVQQAVCEMAVYLSFSYANPEANVTTGLDELKIDVIQLKFSGATARAAIPAAAVALLRGLIATQISSRVGRVQVRV